MKLGSDGSDHFFLRASIHPTSAISRERRSMTSFPWASASASTVLSRLEMSWWARYARSCSDKASTSATFSAVTLMRIQYRPGLEIDKGKINAITMPIFHGKLLSAAPSPVVPPPLSLNPLMLFCGVCEFLRLTPFNLLPGDGGAANPARDAARWPLPNSNAPTRTGLRCTISPDWKGSTQSKTFSNVALASCWTVSAFRRLSWASTSFARLAFCTA